VREVIRANKWTVFAKTSGNAAVVNFEKAIFEHTTSPGESVQRQTRNKNNTRDANIFIFKKKKG